MSVAQRTAFHLERFSWREPDRIEVVGTWTGVPDRLLAAPELVLRAGNESIRLAPAEEPDADRSRRGFWQVAFRWNGDAALIETATLELGSTLAVDLPPLNSPRRRFGRVVLDARRAQPQGAEPPQAAQAPPSPPPQPQENSIALHASLVSAREELEAARADAQEAQEVARRAQQDAIRERERGRAESARMREALETMETLAHQALIEEQSAADELRMQLDEATRELDDLRAGQEEHGQRERRLEAELRAAREEVSALQSRGEALRSQLTETIRAAQERAGDEARALERAQRDLRVSLAETYEGQLDELKQRLGAAEAAAGEFAARAQDAESLQGALDEARAQLAEMTALQDALAAAEQAAHWHHERSGQLERKLDAIRGVLDDAR